MLEVNGLGKSFALRVEKKRGKPVQSDPREAGGRLQALSGIDFRVAPGSIVGLLGANGAGKTTLMRILATSLRPTEGSASLLGFDIVTQAHEVRKRIGFLSGTTGLYNRLSAHELLTFYGRLYGLAEAGLASTIDTLCDEFQIGEYAHRRIDGLSAGMKQRISIARSLIHDPDFIIFDEPTTGLDVPSAQIILNHIEKCRRSGKSVLFSTHHMHEVEQLCDRVVLIERGAVCFQGTVEQMKRQGNSTRLDEAYLALTGHHRIERLTPAREAPMPIAAAAENR